MGVVFSANSSMPFENSTSLKNFLQILSMMLIPSACVVAFGLMVYYRKERQSFVLMKKKRGYRYSFKRKASFTRFSV